MKIFNNHLLRNILAIIGLFSLIVFLSAFIFIAYSMTIGNKEQINKATKSDVRFVLNWCELGDEKIDKVLKSYVSETGFSSDHHDAYLIKIKNVNINSLSNTQTGKWYKGDDLPIILKDAVKFATIFNNETPWFLNVNEILSADCYIYPWYISTNGLSPNSVELIILKPKENLIYYISASI